MKAKPGKVTVSSKAKSATAKSKPVAKAAKPATKAKTVVKAKPVVKTAAKPAVKKAAAKKTAQPGGKKPVAKTVVKAKPAAKPVAAKKQVAKPVPKAKPTAKTVAKPAAKAAKPVKSSTTVSKPVTKPAAKPAAQVAAPVKTTPVPAKPAPAPAPAPVAKSGRVSSRLAQLTVPSMAQSVASTAAKASYIPTMSPTLIVPPLPTAIKKDPKLANNWKTKPAEELTDAELLAMPDGEYMNDKQLAAFRLRLSRLKQDILNNAGETTEHLREDTVVVPDPADRATIEEEHALELRTRDRERKLLKKIEQSIARIDAGDYGYCDETGEPIGVGRLLARPTATLSLEAQQRRELKQKMFGD